MAIIYLQTDVLPTGVIELYRANGWSAADKPEQLSLALRDSHSVWSAWDGERLVEVGNANSNGHLVVYYPQLFVHPEYHGRGMGSELMRRLMSSYEGFHMQILVADGKAVDFSRKCGFVSAGQTPSMWNYGGQDR